MARKRAVGELGEGDINRERKVRRDAGGGGEDGTEKIAEEKAVQSGLFGERDELVWRHQAALRMLPAREDLEAGKQARAQLDDGLEVGNDLVRLKRAAQVGLGVGSHTGSKCSLL